MAKAIRKEVIIKTKEIHLTLSDEEASALSWVVNRVAGHPVNTPRKHIDAIARALNQAGVDQIDWKTDSTLRALCFADLEE